MLLEQRDDGRVAHSSCDGQRRVPSAVRLVRVGAGLQQSQDDGVRAGLRGNMQRRRLIRGLLFGIAPPLQQRD